MSVNQEPKDLFDSALMGLINIENEMDQVERQAEINRLRNLQKVFEKRSEHIQKIDRFWHIVLSQHPEFAEFINSDDLKYIELISDIYIKWDAADSIDDSVDPSNFSITFKFKGSEKNDDFLAQEITKSFRLEKLSQEELIQRKSCKREEKINSITDSDNEDEIEEIERLVSTNCPITWPKSYDSINPALIKDKKTPQGKKKYRSGMKSFFGWFKWTGKKPGKEFPNGDEFAKLLSEDIFPYAVKYYTEAQRDGLDEEIESDASEPLDLSEEEFSNSTITNKKRKFEDE